MRFTFDDLVAVMARLRGPGGCPWDREQTHASLAPYLLEEAHEVLEAISHNDLKALRAELGDLLLQVVFHAQMAREAGRFDAGAVVDGLARKLIDRHPHVFGDVRVGTADEVLAQWHELKRREDPQRGAFDGIPASLPALARAQKVLARAASRTAGEHDAAGQAPLALAQAAGAARRHLDRLIGALAQPGDAREGAGDVPEHLGDLLMAVVALASAAGLDAESVLREACDRFITAQTAPG
ncbi:MAG: nucleoside triphosphate pyrophosphohydrolase [Armatimonadota bacterium]|nr:nucleoside triphosphate pyrophosphohydrolase [Armatimonadota bacterium]